MTFFGILGIVFIALKLTHVIAWPWLWVTAPIWAPLVVTVACMLGGLIVVAFMGSK